jgi:hypothetical protein
MVPEQGNDIEQYRCRFAQTRAHFRSALPNADGNAPNAVIQEVLGAPRKQTWQRLRECSNVRVKLCYHASFLLRRNESGTNAVSRQIHYLVGREGQRAFARDHVFGDPTPKYGGSSELIVTLRPAAIIAFSGCCASLATPFSRRFDNGQTVSGVFRLASSRTNSGSRMGVTPWSILSTSSSSIASRM